MVLMLINTAHHDDYLSNTSTLVAGMQDKVFYLYATAATPSYKYKTEPEPTQRRYAVFIYTCECAIVYMRLCVDPHVYTFVFFAAVRPSPSC